MNNSPLNSFLKHLFGQGVPEPVISLFYFPFYFYLSSFVLLSGGFCPLYLPTLMFNFSFVFIFLISKSSLLISAF